MAAAVISLTSSKPDLTLPRSISLRRAIAEIRSLATALAPNLPGENFRVEAVERMSFGDAAFDLVLSSAVLHFARDEDHWRAMVSEMWRVLKPGGIFFCATGLDHRH